MTRVDTVHCHLCGTATESLGTQLCDPCWDVRSAVAKRPDVALRIIREMGRDPLFEAARVIQLAKEYVNLDELDRRELETQVSSMMFILRSALEQGSGIYKGVMT